jgi:hypothetical protein
MTLCERFDKALVGSKADMVNLAEGLENLAKWMRKYAEDPDCYTRRAIEEVLLEMR